MGTNVISEYTENQIFIDQDFSKKDFTGYSFANCVFKNCNFTDAVLVNSSLWDCSFEHCVFSIINVKGCKMEQAHFKESQIIGVNFSECDTSLVFSLQITHSHVQHCSFLSLAMQKVNLSHNKLYQCQFSETQLQSATFEGSDLQGTTFNRCNLRSANFTGALNYRIHPCLNTMDKARFSFPECVGILQAMDIVIKE